MGVKEIKGKAEFIVFSDGASFNNGKFKRDLPSMASCAAILTFNGKIISKHTDLFEEQTNNYAELKGAIMAIEEMIKKIKSLKKTKIHKPYRIILYSDSQFVVKGASEWIYKWVENDWKGSNGKIVGHKDLWEPFYNNYILNEDYELEFVHIKGHSKKRDFFHSMNNLCDELATGVMNKWKRENLKHN